MTIQAWYREPWPWLLMAGPATVVVAGVITTVIAFRTSDGLVAEDYYKQGLAVNRLLAREKRAEAIGASATAQFTPTREGVQVMLEAAAPLPATLRLVLVHPARASEDRSVELAPVSPGVYRGRLSAPGGVAYRMQLEDGAGTWRLGGRWRSADDSAPLTVIR